MPKNWTKNKIISSRYMILWQRGPYQQEKEMCLATRRMLCQNGNDRQHYEWSNGFHIPNCLPFFSLFIPQSTQTLFFEWLSHHGRRRHGGPFIWLPKLPSLFLPLYASIHPNAFRWFIPFFSRTSHHNPINQRTHLNPILIPHLLFENKKLSF